MASEIKVVRLSEHMTVSVSTEAMEALQALAAEEARLVMLVSRNSRRRESHTEICARSSEQWTCDRC
jgi:hypothetical protein